MSGGGNNQLLDMGLMIAAGIAAPELAPLLMEGGALGAGLGATAATATTGAVLGGTAGALTGQDPLKAAAMGGLGGAAAGYFGGVQAAEPGSMLAAGPTASGAGLSTVPTPAVYPTPPSPNSGFNYLPSGEMTTVPSTVPPTTGPSADVLKQMAQEADAAKLASQPKLFGMPKADVIGGGIAGINEIVNAKPTVAYTPPDSSYKGGSLSKFKYDPSTYQPAQVPPAPYGYRPMAIGGLAMGGQPNQMYPMSQQEHTNFMDPTKLPASAMEVRNFEPATNPMTGTATTPMAKGGIASHYSDLMNSRDSMDKYMSEYASNPSSVYQKAKDGDYNAMLVINKMNKTPNQNYATGGLSSLGMYSDGGRLLKGPGDGVSDNIPARIGQKQEARLADGEFVVPARIVSELGNGSTEAGARRLYQMMDNVQSARKKSMGKEKFAKDTKAYKHLPA